ncbi:MAG: hypothetical protein KME07_10680 [Pegethrix bostrychoides GSE-TBD4-15B]|jgi:hypothetical protein|uniref:Uncharacterized protein n=1 Tax=Pegethrix bostrychoides GSE-TBD4-15B TaxID=2839662 RepID=A0A951U5U9_9CYAN|nr:hypothetical protein [Pegethrix bostrychoides GSE-TBD4-15B]
MAIIAADAQDARLAVHSAGGASRDSSLSNLSMHCSEPPHLKYNITAIEGGVMLSIWEPAPKNDVRVKPFLFMSRHRLPSELEAKKLLAHYLSVYRQATQRS